MTNIKGARLTVNYTYYFDVFKNYIVEGFSCMNNWKGSNINICIIINMFVYWLWLPTQMEVDGGKQNFAPNFKFEVDRSAISFVPLQNWEQDEGHT